MKSTESEPPPCSSRSCQAVEQRRPVVGRTVRHQDDPPPIQLAIPAVRGRRLVAGRPERCDELGHRPDVTGRPRGIESRGPCAALDRHAVLDPYARASSPKRDASSDPVASWSVTRSGSCATACTARSGRRARFSIDAEASSGSVAERLS